MQLSEFVRFSDEMRALSSHYYTTIWAQFSPPSQLLVYHMCYLIYAEDPPKAVPYPRMECTMSVEVCDLAALLEAYTNQRETYITIYMCYRVSSSAIPYTAAGSSGEHYGGQIRA